MTYVMSDLHGCYDKYIDILNKINFSHNDTLYILGDIVDRGTDGIKIILDIIKRKNVIALLGNHEYEAATLLRGLSMPCDDSKAEEFVNAFHLWLSDGGYPTYRCYKRLTGKDKNAVVSYMFLMPEFEEITISNKKYFLSHTVPEKAKMLDFDSCDTFDFILGEPEYGKVYFNDTVIITGHTPTELISKTCKGKIWRGNNHIVLDCGAVFGNPLGCLCLETNEEFYSE